LACPSVEFIAYVEEVTAAFVPYQRHVPIRFAHRVAWCQPDLRVPICVVHPRRRRVRQAPSPILPAARSALRFCVSVASRPHPPPSPGDRGKGQEQAPLPLRDTQSKLRSALWPPTPAPHLQVESSRLPASETESAARFRRCHLTTRTRSDLRNRSLIEPALQCLMSCGHIATRQFQARNQLFRLRPFAEPRGRIQMTDGADVHAFASPVVCELLDA
jgi:hypothetical protein